MSSSNVTEQRSGSQVKGPSGFLAVEKVLLACKDLTLAEKIVWALIHEYEKSGKQVHYSYAGLAKATGTPIPTIKRTAQGLVKRGLLVPDRRPGKTHLWHTATTGIETIRVSRDRDRSDPTTRIKMIRPSDRSDPTTRIEMIPEKIIEKQTHKPEEKKKTSEIELEGRGESNQNGNRLGSDSLTPSRTNGTGTQRGAALTSEQIAERVARAKASIAAAAPSAPKMTSRQQDEIRALANSLGKTTEWLVQRGLSLERVLLNCDYDRAKDVVEHLEF